MDMVKHEASSVIEKVKIRGKKKTKRKKKKRIRKLIRNGRGSKVRRREQKTWCGQPKRDDKEKGWKKLGVRTSQKSQNCNWEGGFSRKTSR